MLRHTLVGALLCCPCFAGCAGAQTGNEATPSSGTSAAATATPAAKAEPEAATPAESDPQIGELAKAALACKVADDTFDAECAAYKAWTGNEPLFAEGKGNGTLLTMLEAPDEKTRLLVGARGMPDSKTFFATKGNAVRLFAVAKKETNARVGQDLGALVASVDAEKLGLAADLRALAKHSLPTFREALAFYLVVRHQTALNLEIAALLMEDSEKRVRENAVGSLSSGGATPPTEAVCKLLSKQLARTDELAAKAMWAAGSSKCKGIHQEVAAALTVRTSDPSKVTNADGVGYSLAIGAVCSSSDASLDAKMRVFAAAQKLTDPAVSDANTRVAAIGALSGCDKGEAEKVIRPLTKDKDKTVASRATKELEEIKKAAAKVKSKPLATSKPAAKP